MMDGWNDGAMHHTNDYLNDKDDSKLVGGQVTRGKKSNFMGDSS
jgi:hypothetical protein